MVNKEKILKRLQEHWNYAVSLGYNEDRFLGIFLYGSQNYGFANEDSDIDSKLIILPSFADMCLHKDWVSKELHYENEHIEIKDIRMLREMFMKQNINYVEILYSEYFILNPKYAELFNSYFIKNRDLISHFDRNKTVKSISGQLLHTLKQDPTDNKKLYNSHRLYYFLRDYLNGKVYSECIQPKAEEYEFLWKLKYGLLEICSDAEVKTKMAMELEEKALILIEEYKDIASPCQKDAADALDNGVIEILKHSFAENQPQAVSKKEFFKQLTNAETKAYYSIIKEIGEEGNITISKLVEKNSISRPVYNNLIIKMKENNVASVVSMGMKGTYIKILEAELKAEAIDFK